MAAKVIPSIFIVTLFRRVLVFTILAAVVCVQSETPEGYIVNAPAGKAYKVIFQAQSWTRARNECEEKGASLAVPVSQDEFMFLQKLVRNMHYPQGKSCRHKLLVWLGISSLDHYTTFKTVDGDDFNEIAVSTWASSNAGFSGNGEKPHCAGMDAVGPGLRHYWCHLRQPYICEIQVKFHGAPNYNNMNEDIEHFLHESYIFQ